MISSKIRRNLRRTRAYADRWRILASWSPRSRLSGVVRVEPYRGEYEIGMSWLDIGEVLIRVGEDLSEALATVLHEYAHVAAYPFEESPHHGPLWAEKYTSAVAEVTGIRLPELRRWLQLDCGGLAGIDPAMRDAIAARGIA